GEILAQIGSPIGDIPANCLPDEENVIAVVQIDENAEDSDDLPEDPEDPENPEDPEDPGKPEKPGKPGKDGQDGEPGKDGQDGKPGKDGKNGKDGKPHPVGLAETEGGPVKDSSTVQGAEYDNDSTVIPSDVNNNNGPGSSYGAGTTPP